MKLLTVFQPLRTAPKLRNAKVCDVPALSLVQPTGNTEVNDDHLWTEVLYVTNSGTFMGWLLDRFLEEFFENPEGGVRIRKATPSPNDGAQYLIHKGHVQYNLCGEFCVCYCAGWEYDLEDWLDEWASKPNSLYSRIFAGGKGRTTGIPDLDNMLSSFEEYQLPSTKIADALFEPLLGRYLLTPGRMDRILNTHRAIISCKIETRFGRLRPSGTLHWVVLENVIPWRHGGMVSLYNPFPNTLETYSWDRFVESIGVPFGILVER